MTAGYAINNNKNGGGGGGSWARANATTDRDAPTDSQRAGDVSSKVVLTFNHS